MQPSGGPGVTVVDVTSTARVHFWRLRASGAALRSSLAVMHHAETWREHFGWALCIATGGAEPDPPPHSGGLQPLPTKPRRGGRGLRQRRRLQAAAGLRPMDKAPNHRCMSVLRHLSHSAEQEEKKLLRPLRGGRPAGRLGRRLQPVRELAPQEAYFASHFRNWTWCEARGTFRKTPGLVLRNRSACGASEDALLRSCQAGWAPSAELSITGSELGPWSKTSTLTR